MKCNRLLLAGAALLLLAGAPEVFAQATTAGTQIKNETTVTYSVGGVTQSTEPTDDVSFLVDRRVDLVVNEVGGGFTSVVPGATPSITNNYFLTYTVTNNTNDVIDVRLTAAELSGQTVHTEADTADTNSPSSLSLYIDNESGGTASDWDAADTAVPQDTGVWYLDQVAAGDTVTVFVVSGQFEDSDTLSNDDVMGVVLTGVAASAWDDPTLPAVASVADGYPTARVADAGNLGADLTEDTNSDDQNAVENVFADAADTDGSGDAAENGQDDAYDAYKVATTTITVTKQSLVYYDPINGDADGVGNEPKAIPGALVLYCITVKNTGASDATDVVVSDAIPNNTAFVDANSAVTNDITSADSIRFSTVDTCTFTDWDNGTAETSDNTDGGTDNLVGDYNVTTAGAVTTSVPTLVDTSGVTTTMFMVEIQ